MKNLILESDLKIFKSTMGAAPIAYIKGDVYASKDILKKYQAKWNGANKFWFWFLNKNNPDETIDKLVRPALKELKEAQNIPVDQIEKEIDQILASMQTEGPSANPDLSVSADEEKNIKDKVRLDLYGLHLFKQFCFINLRNMRIV